MASYHRLYELRENRKTSRLTFWDVRIADEIASVASIGWILQMNLMRSGQLPFQYTPITIKRNVHLQRDISQQALIVYNQIYRDDKCSQFIVADTGNSDLDGRIGVITSYDEQLRCFRTMIRPTRSNNKGSMTNLNVKPEHMEPASKLHWHMYNRTPKPDVAKALIPSRYPDTSGTTFDLKFMVRVFEQLLKSYKHPERQPVEAYESLVKMLIEKEEDDEDQRKEIAKLQLDLNKNMHRFLSSHASNSSRPRKRIRSHGPQLTTSRKSQATALWKSKLEHVRSSMVQGDRIRNEHLFTYPFDVKATSLFISSKGMDEMNDLCSASVNDDFQMPNCMDIEPIVVTTTTLQTMYPGVDMDEDALDFCMKW